MSKFKYRTVLSLGVYTILMLALNIHQTDKIAMDFLLFAKNSIRSHSPFRNRKHFVQ